jgi:hypothetical protein
MHRLIVFVTAALILLSNRTHAQTQNILLRGVSKIRLLIETLSPAAKDCGLTVEAIRARSCTRLAQLGST